jgi:Gpi18-like mannosyltransferase
MILLLLICGIYFEKKNKNIISAALIALSFMFKYTSVLLLPYFLFRKKIKLTLLILLFTIIYCLVPALYVGMDKQKDYLKNWLPSISQTSLDKGSWYDTKNQSLYSLVLRTFTKDSPYSHKANLDFNQGLALAAILAAIIYIPILIPKAHVSENLDYSLLLISMALFNPNGWLSNFVFLLFGYMVILYYLIKNGILRNKTISILTFLSFAISSWGCESLVGDNLQNFLEMLSTVTIASLIVIFLLFWLRFKATPKEVQ